MLFRKKNVRLSMQTKRSMCVRWGLLFALFGLVVLSLMGCSTQSKCFVDRDCPQSKYCEANVCVQGCTNDEMCPADHTCNLTRGNCMVGGCKPKAKKSCINGHLFWLNSCGAQEKKADDCGTRGCQGQSCNAKGPAVCGNGNCDFSENCVSCPKDCSCAPGICDTKTATCLEQNLCGNNKCDPGENCAHCSKDCKCSGSEVCDPVGQKCIVQTACGNGSCETAKGENCSTCIKDCPCPSKQICQSGACVEPSACGNGVCDTTKGENCSTCSKDCACKNGQQCINSQCKDTKGCNNDGFCQSNRDENCSNCAGDCGCSPRQKCINQKCQVENLCGNSRCDKLKGENCGTCSKDCSCGAKEVCKRNTCHKVQLCGNGICESSEGENCTTCSKDCACKAGQQCKNGSCQASCGNGSCEASKGETCSTCPKDCACSNGKICRSGTCGSTGCPSGTNSIWNCNTAKTKRQRCGVLTGYKLLEERCPYGCKVNTLYDTCCTCKAGAKRCVSDGLERCKSSCDGWEKVKTCNRSEGQYCSTIAGDCKCTVVYACPKLYAYQCLGKERQWCWKSAKTGCQHWIKSRLQCSGSTPVCNKGQCCACIPGTQRCSGTKIEVCSSDCKSWKLKQKCSSGLLCCNLKCSCTD